jgi:hypothetical protein
MQRRGAFVLPLGVPIALLAGLAAAGVAAQESPELVTDRPDQTESAVVVPEDTFQIELGATFSREETAAVRLDALEVPGTLLRWGVSPRWELRLAWPGWIETESRFAGGASGRESGLGDPEIGTKISLLSAAAGGAFDLALLAHVSLPVGDELLGSPRADPSIRLNGAHDLAEGVGIGWNVGYETHSFEDARGEHTLGRFLYTVAAGFDLSPRLALFVELFGDLPGSDVDPAAHSFDAGITWLVTPRVQLDLSGGVGLDGPAPDWFVGTGVSLRVPR